MQYTIEELQRILNVSDDALCEKLNITKQRLKTMKTDCLKRDFLQVKSVLAHERVKVIKFLK